MRQLKESTTPWQMSIGSQMYLENIDRGDKKIEELLLDKGKQ